MGRDRGENPYSPGILEKTWVSRQFLTEMPILRYFYFILYLFLIFAGRNNRYYFTTPTCGREILDPALSPGQREDNGCR